MKRIASKMKLLPGFEAEYRKRHDELWPELTSLLLSRGINRYSIFLDETSLDLFAVFEVNETDQWETLADQPVMKRWWEYMKDIMETNPDNSPVSIPLKEVFYLAESADLPAGN